MVVLIKMSLFAEHEVVKRYINMFPSNPHFTKVDTERDAEKLKSLGYIEFDTSDPNNLFMYCPQLEERVYCFWTGTNPMSQRRKAALASVAETVGVDVSLVTPDTLSKYILQAHPLHRGFRYLSEVHKADYLRTYFMHFYGGGYADIKLQTGSWKPFFSRLGTSPYLICGYKESGPQDIANDSVKHAWAELIGNGAYICKPNTDFTKEWYSRMMARLDELYPALVVHPASHPRDKKEDGHGYPVEWNELLGRIFHAVCFTYKNSLLQELPTPVFSDYL
jgi:hypothetical protein